MLETAEKMQVQMPSLRAIAEALGIHQQRIYSVAKKPIPGTVYDPKEYNWEAITRFCEKRFSSEIGVESFEQLITNAIEIDKTLATRDRRFSGATKVMIDAGDGKMVPERRKDFELGAEVALKGKATVLKVVYKNDFSIVFESIVPKDGTLAAMSNNTLNQKVYADDQVMADEIKERKENYVPAQKAEAGADA